MIHIVGAGSGAADLITLRGARLLRAADVVVWAGSLVNPELLAECKESCIVYDSAHMTLEEVLDVMCAADARGEEVVRLHTGDPCLYGAIQEQMDALDARGVDYEVVPGVSSFCGAAAALRQEYTLPGISQSVVITRLSGRTPMPAGESMRTMAESGSTMVIFLSSGMLAELSAELHRVKTEMNDYYTAWVHQIKTPIAVIRMTVHDDDTPEHRAVLGELFRIEQYVDMVLQYARLDSETNDLVIAEYALDPILRASVRKFAPQFVAKRLALNYDGTDLTVITDKKWLSVIIDQLLSNAIKYTPSGAVGITVEPPGLLCISDTGIGIAPQDLPRIFERGYTGENGRLEKRSSGLGLYLCRRAADMLSVPLRAESTPGEGSRFILDLSGGRAGNG